MIVSAETQTRERVHKTDRTNPVKSRQRKVHHKVRSGCLTCKRRRKKCDEAKPFCSRCIRGSFFCEGYEDTTVHSYALHSEPVDFTARKELPYAVHPCELSSSFSIAIEKEGLRHPFNAQGLPFQKFIGNHTLSQAKIIDLDLPESESDEHTGSHASAYEQHSSSGYQTSPSTSVSSNNRARSPAFLQLLKGPLARPNNLYPSNLEAQCFTFFQVKTLPLLASYFEASVWRSDMGQCALSASDPVLFSVAAALGAVHRRYTLGITPEALEYCLHSENLYRKAQQAIRNIKQSSHSDSLLPRNDIIMAGEILLGVFQAFQDEEIASRKHIQTALSFAFGGMPRVIHSERWRCMTKSRPRVVCNFIHRLYCRAIEILDSPISVPFTNEDSLIFWEIPDEFSSVEQMRDLLFAEIDNVSHAAGRLLQDAKSRQEFKVMHETRLAKWSAAFTLMVEKHEHTSQFRKICNLLHLARSVCYIMMWVSLFLEGKGSVIQKLPILDQDQLPFTSWEHDHELVHTARAVFEAMVMMTKFGWDMLTGTKGLLEAITQSHGIFRFHEEQHATEARDEDKTCVNASDGFRDPSDGASSIDKLLGVFGLAERVSANEEEMIVKAVLRNLPSDADPVSCDIACPAAAVNGTRTVLVRYYLPHPDSGYWWIQDWWSYGTGSLHLTATGF